MTDAPGRESRFSSGPAPGADDGLREQIRSRIAAGALPRVHGRVSVRTAQGNHHCMCCEKSIRASTAEYEVRDLPEVYAHLECFSLWQQESEGSGAPGTSRAG